jgi:hypothetical protein
LNIISKQNGKYLICYWVNLERENARRKEWGKSTHKTEEAMIKEERW